MDPNETTFGAVSTLAGTNENFGAWAQACVPAMARLAARLGPPGERDDIVQQALVQAWRHRSSFDRTRGEACGWLLAITANESRKAFRGRGPIRLPARGIVDRIDDRLDLHSAIGRLAPRQRLAVDCYYFADLSISQTARVMKCAEGTVKATLADARLRLRNLIGEQND